MPTSHNLRAFPNKLARERNEVAKLFRRTNQFRCGLLNPHLLCPGSFSILYLFIPRLRGCSLLAISLIKRTQIGGLSENEQKFFRRSIGLFTKGGIWRYQLRNIAAIFCAANAPLSTLLRPFKIVFPWVKLLSAYPLLDQRNSHLNQVGIWHVGLLSH